jgi:carbonic anhydrase
MERKHPMYHVDSLVISCIDFRFRPKIAAWIKKELNDSSDLVAIAGASKAILDEDTQASVLKQIDIALRLHEIKTVFILDHIDCGAYGGSKEFTKKDDEVAMHKEELQKAGEVIVRSFPNMDVKGYIVDFQDIIAVSQ